MAYDGQLVFDTKVDKKGFEKGIEGLKGVATKSMKVVTGLIAGATTAIVGIGTASVKVGSTFEKGMSNLSATMGITVEEIQKGDKSFQMLEAAALEMGKTTQFSASQATDAMNELALAGYNAEKTIDTLPSVLNLAAAGGLELGQSAEIITNSMNALGLEVDQASSFVDEMAVTAQKSGTTVAQLGEGILTVGGTAKMMAGGTVELSTQLGILADAGIKGAEGGTALRNVLLSLSAPTDKQAKQMKALGVEAYDANGNLRSTDDIFQDLNKVLGTMTEQEKTEVLSNLFNKVDLKAANALLAGSGERFGELSNEIANSEGAAAAMAETLNDNLLGKVELLKSAMEGLGISIYKSMDTPLKGVIETMTGYVDQVSGVLTAHDDIEASAEELGVTVEELGINLSEVPNGLEGAVEVIGEIIADIIAKVAEGAPKLLEAAIEMMKSFINGIQESLPSIIESAVTLIQSFIEAVVEMIPILVELGFDLVLGLIQGIAEMLPDLITQAIDLVIAIADTVIENIDTIIDVGIAVMMAMIEGIMDNLPKLIEEVPRIINEFSGAIYNNLPKILKAAVGIMLEIIKGLIQSIPTLVANIPQIIMAIVNVFTLYNWYNIGSNLISKIRTGIEGMGPKLLQAVINLGQNIVNGIANIFTQAPSIGSGFVRGVMQGISNLSRTLISTVKTMGNNVISGIKNIFTGQSKGIGSDLVKGIWNGIDDVTDWILRKIRGFGDSVMRGIKGIFGIKSPSTIMRDEIGKNLILGMGEGIDREIPKLQRDLDNEMGKLTARMKSTVDFESGTVGNQLGRSSISNIKNINNDNNKTEINNQIVVKVDKDTPISKGRDVGREIGKEFNKTIRGKGVVII